MVKIEAIIRPERVNQVVQALEDIGCKGFHFVNVTGQGQQQGVEVFTGRGAGTAIRTALPKTLISTVVAEEMKEGAIEAILSSARAGEEGAIGDGKIFITRIDEVIRVSSGERGTAAI